MITKKQKKLGQVFLKDKTIIKKIIKAGKVESKDQILEIGPGRGILTKALLKTEANIVAVEKDQELVEFLKSFFKDKQNLKIIHADIRDLLKTNQFYTQYSILNTQYKVIGNIPYYLTSHLLRLLLENPINPSLIVLMIQKEVAERIIAQPPKMNLLSASVQFYAK
ncbi:MAG TPA: rRNA adenine N-6-methyltransferase family protein, partial [Bacillota bacterium]|nr:rRNA adenine N-6-methyltransferase family protein [Bacillota bacterium]